VKDWVLHEKSCGAVIFINNQEKTRYLLLNYAAGHWDFVKGNVEPNEMEKQTVTRELQEETGITDAKFIDGFRESIKV
jgi:bis(5'-nucleosidyl)-tetraphosphatase